MEMTVSPSAKLMPRTYMESSPLRRARRHGKRMHWPSAVVNNTSSSTVQASTPTMPQPHSASSRSCRLRLAWSEVGARCAGRLPPVVANITSAPPSPSSSGSSGIEVMRSSFSSEHRPAPCRAPGGAARAAATPWSCRPGRARKNRIGAWVENDEAGPKSSSLVAYRAALAARAAGRSRSKRRPLDPTGMGHGDDHVLAGGQSSSSTSPSKSRISINYAGWHSSRTSGQF